MPADFWRCALRQSSSSSACNAAPAPLARNLGGRLSSFCVRRARSAERSRPAPPPGRRRTARAVVSPPSARAFDARRRAAGAGTQMRGEQGERERPIQPLSEHGVGEPRRERLALPSPAPQRRAPRPRSGRPRQRRKRAPRRTAPAGRRRRRPRPPRAPLAALRREESPEPRRRRQTRTATAGSGGLAKLPPGEKELAGRSGIAAWPAEVERVAQSRLVFGAAGAGDAGGGGA